MVHLLTLLAASSPAPEMPITDNITAGGIGAAFFVGLGVASFLLWRNMDARIKRLDRNRRTEQSGSDEN